MTENMKKFLELLSRDEELGKKLSSASKEAIIAIAREQGVELTDADFAQNNELSDDELDAVAGGWTECVCAVGGGGAKDSDGKTCACVGYGQGDSRDGRMRCICPAVGGGIAPESLYL